MTTTASPGLPDVRQLQQQQRLVQSPFPASAEGMFRIYIDPAVQRQIAAHTAEDANVEVCGVLVGRWGCDAGGTYVAITAYIRGDASENKFAEVTFTHETWARINKRMDTEFSDQAIVGWYHSHPDFGIFLSDRDRFIHEHFFSGAGQVAYVLDPVRRIEGFFQWSAGKPATCPFYWVGDEIRAAPPSPADEPHSQGSAQVGRPANAGRDGPAPGQRGFPLLAFSAAAAALLGGYLLGMQQSSWDRARIVEGVMAHYGTFSLAQVGLPDALGLLSGELVAASRAMETAASQDSSEAGVKQARESLESAAVSLSRARAVLAQIRNTYTLPPDQQAILERLIALKTAELSLGQAERARSSRSTSRRGAAERTAPPESSPATPPAQRGEADAR